MKRTIKKICCAVMAVIMIVIAIPFSTGAGNNIFGITASAATIPESGTCGENLTFTYDSNTGLLTISGEGKMDDYNSPVDSPFYIKDTGIGNKSPVKTVVFTNGVTRVGKYAFWRSRYLTDVSFSDSVVEIGEDAFLACEKITDIYIPEAESIERYAFSQCKGLTDVTFGKSLSFIGDHAFQSCEKITDVYIPENVSSIGNACYEGCPAITNITVSSSNKVYDSRNNCNAIIETETNTLIAGCQNTVIPNDITNIGPSSFYGCSHLMNITIPNSVKKISSSAFLYCTGLTDVIIPESVSIIDFCAFMYCENLKSITLPDTVTSIEQNAFMYCKSLTEITLPKGMTIIDNDTFRDCTSLKSVVISENIRSIGSGAFSGCTALINISVDSKNIYLNSRNNCNAIINTSLNKLVKGCKTTVIPNDVASIGSSAFSGIKDLTSIVIPESVTSIEAGAFYSCTNLKDIYYPGSEDEWNLISVNSSNNDDFLNATVHYYYNKTEGSCGENAEWKFSEEEGILYISGSGETDSFDTFEKYAWSKYKDDIKYVEVSDGITSLGSNAFSACSEINEVYFGKDLTSIGSNAFADCENLVLVCMTADDFNAESAFKNNSNNITFIVSENNKTAQSYANKNNIPAITVSFSEKTVDFKGITTVYGNLDYKYLTNFVNKYSSAEFLHFDKLIFDGVEPDTIIIEDCENVDTSVKYFALEDLTVSLNVIKDGTAQKVTFAQMLDLLESGDFDAFKLVMKSKDIEEKEETFFEKVKSAIDEFATNALRLITKAVNFIVKIFKKK